MAREGWYLHFRFDKSSSILYTDIGGISNIGVTAAQEELQFVRQLDWGGYLFAATCGLLNADHSQD